MTTKALNNMTKNEREKLRYEANKEKFLLAAKERRAVSGEEMNARTRAWYQANKESIRQKRAQYAREYRKDPLVKLAHNMRVRLKTALKQKKSKSTMVLVGCSLPDLKKHLEKQFQPGMTWLNYGLWHVDHIIPLSSAKSVEEMQNLCKVENLQPLWACDNKKKKDKVL